MEDEGYLLRFLPEDSKGVFSLNHLIEEESRKKLKQHLKKLYPAYEGFLVLLIYDPEGDLSHYQVGCGAVFNNRTLDNQNEAVLTIQVLTKNSMITQMLENEQWQNYWISSNSHLKNVAASGMTAN